MYFWVDCKSHPVILTSVWSSLILYSKTFTSISSSQLWIFMHHRSVTWLKTRYPVTRACKYSDCYAMTAHTAWLELGRRQQWLAPSNIHDRQLNGALAVGSWHLAGVSRNGKGSTLWQSQSRVFHLDGRCCVDRCSATEGRLLKLRLDSARTGVQGLHWVVLEKNSDLRSKFKPCTVFIHEHYCHYY